MSFSIIEAIKERVSDDTVAQIASATGETTPKAKSVLSSGVVAAVAGIIDRGSSREGAQGLLASVKGGSPMGIFGSRKDELVSAVASSSGTSQATAEKVLGTLAPIAAVALGKHVISKGLNADGLSAMLMEQKRSLLSTPNLHPALGRFLGGREDSERVAVRRADVSESNMPVRTAVPPPQKAPRWGALAAVALAGLAIVGLFALGRHREEVPRVEIPKVTAPETPKPEAPNIAPQPTQGTQPTEVSGQTSLTSGEVAGVKNPLNDSFMSGKPFVLPDANFEFGTTNLVQGGDASVDSLAELMNTNKDARIRLDGYADKVGASSANDKLSKDRADEIKKMLVAKGIDESRIETGSHGAKNPVATNDTAEGRQANRRIEVTVLSK